MSKKNLLNGNQFVVIPVSGCGSIGMNMTLYGFKDTWIMVDCGVGFADPRIMPGVDLNVVDISFFKEYGIKIDALIITHAHEDHIGAVVYLWEQLKCPIYCTIYASHWLRAKAADEGIADKIDIRPQSSGINESEKITIKNISFELINLTHSIVEMNGVLLQANGKTVFHTGDWKLDDQPVVGDKSNIEKLEQIGKNGLDLILCDSTNIFKDNATPSEGLLQNSLIEIIKNKKGRIVVTMFSSNIARIHTLNQVAKLTDRTLAITGTSLLRSIGAAQKSGYLTNLDFIDMRAAGMIERDKLLLVSTGCQGEPLASTAKLSSHRHPLLKLSQGDTVIFSATEIPVNMRTIHDTMSRFVANGIEVITNRNALVHVSGHPGKHDIKALYSMIKPKVVMPVHGSPMHLQEHCNFAHELGYKNTIMTTDGAIYVVGKDGVNQIGSIEVDYLGIDGLTFRHPGDKVMRERRRITNGVVVCSVVLNKQGKLAGTPIFTSVGTIDESTDGDLLDELEIAVSRVFSRQENKFSKGAKSAQNSASKLEESIETAIAKVIKKILGIHPIIKVVVQAYQ